jgi:mRNA interferase MazF
VNDPRRGEVWLGVLGPAIGHEQAGKRPLLVISDDRFNSSSAGLVIVIPLTSRNKHIPHHVAIAPPEAGLTTVSYAKCEDVRSIARERLETRWGKVSGETIVDVEDRLRLLLRL